MNQDLRIGGDGSPISLKKVLDTPEMATRELTVLIDGTGCGIAKDAEDVLYVTPEACKMQAMYYCKEMFDGKQIPAYIFRHIMFLWYDRMFSDDKIMIEELEKEAALKTDEIEAGDGISGLPEYKSILGMLQFIDYNEELQQCLGLIQLLCGSLSVARKENKGIRIYLDKPETNLHPKRQAAIMTVINKIREEYGKN
jgi:hypothetical protein